MNFVEPIRSGDTVNKMIHLLGQKSDRNRLMFCVGIYTALRISDILKLRVCDIKNDWGIKEHIVLTEQKTGKKQKIYINKRLKIEFGEFLAKNDYEYNSYLFASQKGYNKPITRIRAYQIIKAAAQECGIYEAIGTHTMRKTFAYHYLKNGGVLATLQKMLNHSSATYTLLYAGINQDARDDAIKNMEY